MIGLQYAVTSMVFLLIGFGLMLMMRWQLAYPFQPMPFGGGVMSPEFYNQLGAMHGTIMIFLGVVPLAVGGFGNYLIPLQIGAGDMAFPRLNMVSYWTYLAAGLVMVASFFLLLLAFPPLASAALMQLMDRVLDTSTSAPSVWRLSTMSPVRSVKDVPGLYLPHPASRTPNSHIICA